MRTEAIMLGGSAVDEKGKKEAMTVLLKSEGQVMLEALEKRLKANRTQDYFVGNKHSIADFCAVGALVQLVTLPEYKNHFEVLIKSQYPLLILYTEKRLKDFDAYYRKCHLQLHYFDIPLDFSLSICYIPN